MTAKCETPSVILRRGQKWLTNSPIRLPQWQRCPNTSQFKVHCKFQQECRWSGRMPVKIQNDGKMWDNGATLRGRQKWLTNSPIRLIQWQRCLNTVLLEAHCKFQRQRGWSHRMRVKIQNDGEMWDGVCNFAPWAKVIDKLTYSIDPMAMLSQY